MKMYGGNSYIWIGICDDEPEEIEEIHKIVCDYLSAADMVGTVSAFTDIQKCMELYQQSGGDPDVLFMDIELENENLNGIDYAQKINQISPCCQIVFVTRHQMYALDAYNAEHCYFVTKEQLSRRLPDIFMRLEKRQEFIKKNSLAIAFDKQNHLLMQKDIRYIEHWARHTYIYGRRTNPYMVNEKLDKLLARLHPVHFMRCHKSYIVNLFYVSDIQDASVLLNDGTQVPVSRRYKSAVLTHVQTWAGELI